MQTKYKSFRKEFDEIITSSNKILITSHLNPDDDSISSVLGVYAFLTKNLNKSKVDIYYSGGFSTRWNYFENFKEIKSCFDIAEILENYDLVIFLDGSQFHRFSKQVERIENSKVQKICIDHHASTIDKFDISIIDSERTSCSEMIYNIFYSDLEKIEKRICEVILLGIIGDTGTFKFITPKQGEIFLIIKKLIEFGQIDIQLLKSKYEGFSIEAIEFFKKVLSNSKVYKIEGVPDFVLTFVNFEDVDNSGLRDEQISESTHIFTGIFATNIRNISWGMVFYPQNKNNLKVSMRSIPESTNVRILGEKLAEKFGGQGGGHDRAGGLTFLNIDKSKGVQYYIDLVLEFLKVNSVDIS